MVSPVSLRFPVLLLTACALAGAAAAPAQARERSPGFAIDAVGFDSYFRYRVDPGHVETGRLRLVNRSARPLTVLLSAADVTTAATGGLQYGTRHAGGDGTWLRLDRPRLRLAPGRAGIARFRLRVPRTATDGDHFAGIVAINRNDLRAARRRGHGGGLTLRFLPRLAIAVQMTVPGARTHELTSGAAGIEVAPSATNATLAVRNTGNGLIRETSGDLALVQGDTVLARRYLDLSAFVPRTEIRLRVPFEGTPARGEYQLRGTLRPEGARPIRVNETIDFGEEAARQFKQKTGREATASGVPAILVAVGGAAGLLALATLLALLRRQRRQLAELAAARSDGREPSRV